jgi:hypothetical protein
MSTRPLRLVSAAVCTAFGVLVAGIGGFGTLASAFDDSRDNDLWVYIVFGLGLIGVGVLLLGLAHALAFPHGSARTRLAAAPVVVATFFPYASALEGRGWIAVNVMLGLAALTIALSARPPAGGRPRSVPGA